AAGARERIDDESLLSAAEAMGTAAEAALGPCQSGRPGFRADRLRGGALGCAGGFGGSFG
ncbi:MAG: hypothetical protein JWL67_1171, partial [Solirubrobacterales bacterium]|nr:hypothetical protein [Solirubrobacterales bacterium]